MSAIEVTDPMADYADRYDLAKLGAERLPQGDDDALDAYMAEHIDPLWDEALKRTPSTKTDLGAAAGARLGIWLVEQDAHDVGLRLLCSVLNFLDRRVA